jgi:hypothetical protein
VIEGHGDEDARRRGPLRGDRRGPRVLLDELRELTLVVEQTHEERRALQDELMQLKSTRLHHLAQMRALVDAHGRMLDALEAQD